MELDQHTEWDCYESLRPQKIEAIMEHSPIAYLPWGALEYHGTHNPVGLDSQKAYHLCKALASKCGGLVFPPINLAANLIKSYPGVDFPKHSIEFSEGLIKGICEEYLEQLVQQEFKIVVLLSGHAGLPHLDILKHVAHEFNNKYTAVCFWAFAEFDLVPDHILEPNHSAFGETSLQLFFEPDTVDLGSLPKEGPINLKDHAVNGKNPRNASAEKGEHIANTFLRNATKKMAQLKKIYLNETGNKNF